MSWNFSITLIPQHQLRAHEEIEEERLSEVSKSIEKHGIWMTPILVERSSFTIMDGHHRLEFARRQALFNVPCVLAVYDNIQVSARRAGFSVTPAEIIRRASHSDLFPPKTTRHTGYPKLENTCAIPLENLAQNVANGQKFQENFHS